MLTNYSKIAMIGAGAIGGITTTMIQEAGQDIEIVCRHQDLADRIKGK